MSVQSYRDLRVWQASMDLVTAIYGLTDGMPKHELYGLTSQIQRSAVSIPSNIAEGHTREHTREYLHHLSIAQASLAELETQLEIARRLKYAPEDAIVDLVSRAASLGRQLYALRNALVREERTPYLPAPRPLTPDPSGRP